MKPVLLGFLFCAALAAQTASVEGITVNQTTGQPLAGVHVRLVTGDFSDMGENQLVYGAISDPAGHFSITDIKPGLYIVVPERTGFVEAPAAKPSGNMPLAFVPLKPGQHLTGYKLQMTPRATVSGRVVDEYGDPVQHVNTQLESAPGNPPEISFFGQGGSSTDERGEFHVVTPPGRYYLKAEIYRMPQDGTEIRTDGSSAAPFVSTYYPSATAASGASIVQAAPGQDIAGLEVHLLRGKVATSAGVFTISGIVTGIPDNASTVRVVVQHGESPDQLNNSSSTNLYGDNKFTFPRMEPGYYRLSAQYSSGKTHLQSQPVDLTLGAADETNVQLTLAPAEDLTGTLVFSGDVAPAAVVGKRTIHLEPTDPNAYSRNGDDEGLSGDIDPSGAFRIANVSPGHFRPVVEPLPENSYIQSVMVDNAPAADNVLDLSHGVKGTRVKIIVDPNGAQISGTVFDKDGQPLVSPMVMVILASSPEQLKEMEPDDDHRAIEGKYSIKAIHPGKYRIFAFDVLSLMAYASDSDPDDEALMKSVFNAAEEIEIKGGDHIVKDLKAIDKPPDKEPHAGQ